jgi:hypothetical protein
VFDIMSIIVRKTTLLTQSLLLAAFLEAEEGAAYKGEKSRGD